MKLPIEINARGKLVEKLNLTAQQQIISQYISSQAGRAALAASMIQPLRRRLNFAGIARQVFPVQQLPDSGASVYYPPEDKVFGERVTVPEFEIYGGRKKLFINNRGKLVHESI